MYANSLLIEVNCRRSSAAFHGLRFRNVLVLVPISVRRRARIYIRNKRLGGYPAGAESWNVGSIGLSCEKYLL